MVEDTFILTLLLEQSVPALLALEEWKAKTPISIPKSTGFILPGNFC